MLLKIKQEMKKGVELTREIQCSTMYYIRLNKIKREMILWRFQSD